jgi:hypothetical protein
MCRASSPAQTASRMPGMDGSSFVKHRCRTVSSCMFPHCSMFLRSIRMCMLMHPVHANAPVDDPWDSQQPSNSRKQRGTPHPNKQAHTHTP